LILALVKAYLASSFQQGSESREGDVEPRWKGRGWSRWTVRSRQQRRDVEGGCTKGGGVGVEGGDGVASREVAMVRHRH
jgi:hypothetical protein